MFIFLGFGYGYWSFVGLLSAARSRVNVPLISARSQERANRKQVQNTGDYVCLAFVQDIIRYD